MHKDFPTAYVMSTLTGRLMSDGMSSIYEVLNWMTDENVMSHQFPRIMREARKVLVKRYPAMAQAVDEAEQVTQENWQTWRDRWIDRYGPTIAVPKFDADTHERIDPHSELAEQVHPDRIIVAKPRHAT